MSHRLRHTVLATLVLASGACGTRAAQATASGDGPEAVVRRHIQAENAHDVDSILATLADTVLYTMVRTHGDTSFVADRSVQRTMYARAVSAVPKSRFEILTVLTSGPVVVTRERISGLSGGASDVGVTAYRVERGRIVRLQILNDSERSPEP